MSGETNRQRVRRRFAFGALEQLASIFGGITASILTVGLFLPTLGALGGLARMLEHYDRSTAPE
jgi:hypothetical protein